MRSQHVRRLAVTATTLVLGAGVLAGCGGEVRAERQGRQVGEAICDVTEADTLEEAERQLDQAQRQMNDLQRIVGRPVDEDVEDVEENLRDLVEHVQEGQDVLVEQDIAVIQRNVDAVSRTLSGKGRAAYDGVQQGLGDCDY